MATQPGNPSAKPNCFGDLVNRIGTSRFGVCHGCHWYANCKTDAGASLSPQYKLRVYGQQPVGPGNAGFAPALQEPCPQCAGFEAFWGDLMDWAAQQPGLQDSLANLRRQHMG